MDPASLKFNTAKIYKSKIANVPTPGYSGHNSIFHKPVSYLNKDKIDQLEEMQSKITYDDEQIGNNMSESFKQILELNKEDEKEVKNYNIKIIFNFNCLAAIYSRL